MRAALRQSWLATAVLASALIGSCSGSRASTTSQTPTVVTSQPHLLFEESPVGGKETQRRWMSSPDTVVRGFLTDSGSAGIEIEARAGASVRAHPRHRPDYLHASRAVIDVDARNASPEHPVELELAFYDDTRANRWWRLIRIEQPGWQRLDIELPFLRYDRGLVPKWEDTQAWGFTFRTDATLRIRSFELWQDEPQSTPYLGVDDLALTFAEPAKVRHEARGDFVVLSDHPGLDMDAVLAALEDMQRLMRARFPAMPSPQRPVPLIVFSDESSYRDFWDRYAEQLGTSVRPLAQDEGYSWLGIATASYDDSYGPVRPTYVHEASHALIERSLGLDAHRSWLFEGLANVDQLAISKQDIGAVYRTGLVRSGVKMPLYEMVSGAPIPTSRYWQATMLMHYFLADPGRTVMLNAALDDMRRTGTVDLRPLLDTRFGMDVPRLSASFWSWGWGKYARGSGA